MPHLKNSRNLYGNKNDEESKPARRRGFKVVHSYDFQQNSKNPVLQTM